MGPDGHWKCDWDNAQRAYWDIIADEYDSLYDDAWSEAEDEQTKLLLRAILDKPVCNILDLACGTGLGYSLAASINRGINYVGLDVSPRMVAKCKERWPNLLVEQGSMDDLSRFTEESFDAVISLNTSFSYTSNPQATLSEIYRVLKINGDVLISALNRRSLRKFLAGRTTEYDRYQTRKSLTRCLSTPARAYSLKELRELVESGGFLDVVVHGQGILAGVLQRDSLWGINSVFSRLFPNLCHTLNLTAHKS